jgi:hypothetical protein
MAGALIRNRYLGIWLHTEGAYFKTILATAVVIVSFLIIKVP